MPLLLALAALLGTSGFAINQASKAGLTPVNSQTGTPGTLETNTDKVGSAVSLGIILVAGAFAYSLVKR